jgi:hypothetical protein
MQILQPAVGADTMDIWVSPASESLRLLANFTKLSKCSNFPSIMRKVSMDEREIFHLMKWATTLDLTDASLLIPIPSPMTSRPWNSYTWNNLNRHSPLKNSGVREYILTTTKFI